MLATVVDLRVADAQGLVKVSTAAMILVYRSNPLPALRSVQLLRSTTPTMTRSLPQPVNRNNWQRYRENWRSLATKLGDYSSFCGLSCPGRRHRRSLRITHCNAQPPLLPVGDPLPCHLLQTDIVPIRPLTLCTQLAAYKCSPRLQDRSIRMLTPT